MNPNENVRILVVDDTEDNLDLICDVFADLPYELLTARNAEDALDIAHRDHLHLAILDVQMPDVDGYDLCKRLRTMPDMRRFPVIFLTA